MHTIFARALWRTLEHGNQARTNIKKCKPGNEGCQKIILFLCDLCVLSEVGGKKVIGNTNGKK